VAKTSKTRAANLREDCVTEALSIIAQEGLDKLSLREVARRLGVSHQAPYKHYPSRDHLLAEVVKRAYAQFAEYLDARPKGLDAASNLRTMGKAYVRYALSHPLEYRLMFNTSLPDPAHHPDMLKYAHHAFDMLRDALRQRRGQRSDGKLAEVRDIDHQALFVWSTLHGLVSLMRSDIASSLKIGAMTSASDRVLDRIGNALDQGTGSGRQDGARESEQRQTPHATGSEN
jgi:AcrR family transcriptional regulator